MYDAFLNSKGSQDWGRVSVATCANALRAFFRMLKCGAGVCRGDPPKRYLGLGRQSRCSKNIPSNNWQTDLFFSACVPRSVFSEKTWFWNVGVDQVC